MQKYTCKHVDDDSTELEIEADSMDDAVKEFAYESWGMAEFESAEVEVRGPDGVTATYTVYADVDVTFDIDRVEPK